MASLYIHIPFCQKKCPYCDFYSIENARGVEGFLGALLREISSCGRAAPFGESVAKEPIETIFFGGGTPSVLSPSQLERILAGLHAVFRVLPDAEITLEANPGRVDCDNLRGYRALGVNRLSLGIQSFDEKELEFLGRIHGAAESVAAIEEARAAGFENLSLDLIYALPGQTRREWEATLRAALEYSPEHISAYSLIVEEGTPLARMVGAGLVTPSPMEIEAAMFEAAMEILTGAGYEHYEVSNYARPGRRCRHNLAYWSHGNYLGFGPSAHSFWHAADWQRARRWWNIANVRTYVERLREGKPAVASGEDLEAAALINERIFLGLRSDGLRMKGVEEDFRFVFQARQRDLVRALREEGLAVLEEGTLRLTSRGYLLCDEIGERFFL